MSLMVRQVGVEGADQIVAIPPGVRDGHVGFVAERVAVADEVHPVPGPALAEVRRSQQPVNHSLQGIGRLVVDKVLDLLRRRGQPEQREVDSPEQRTTVRGRRRSQPGGFEPGEDEPVDAASHPPLVLDSRWRRCAHGPPGPVRGPPLSHVRSARRRDRGRLHTAARPGGSQLDPPHQGGHLLVRQPPPGRHLQFRARVSDGLDEPTLLRLPRDDGRAAFATLEEALATIHEEPGLDLLGLRRMAAVAMFREQRPHPPLEELGPGLVRPAGRVLYRADEEGSDQAEETS